MIRSSENWFQLTMCTIVHYITPLKLQQDVQVVQDETIKEFGDMKLEWAIQELFLYVFSCKTFSFISLWWASACGGLGSPLPSKLSPDLPAPWITSPMPPNKFSMLPKLFLTVSLLPQEFLCCCLFNFLCLMLPRIFPSLPAPEISSPAPCSLVFYPPCSWLPGCFAPFFLAP